MSSQILLAEDDPLIAEIYASFLVEAGYIVTIVTNGIALLEQIKTCLPDLIVLDIIMPHMNGYEVLQNRQNSKEFSNIPVIVLTGLNEKNEIKKILELGANDYFDKTTVELEPLLSKIALLLE